MKKIILVIIAFCLSVSPYFAFAADGTSKPTIVFIYSSNAGKSIDNSMNKEIENKITQSFVANFSGKYNIIVGDSCLDKMKDAGMTDLSLAERSDIISFFAKDNVDYIVIFEGMPFGIVDSTTETAMCGAIPISFTTNTTYSNAILKIIDIKNNVYLYNGRFAYQSEWAPFTGHVEHMFKKLKIRY